MNKRVLGISALILTCSAYANQTEVIVNMAMEQLKASGQLDAISKCAGKPDTAVLAAYKGTMEHCFNKHGLASADENALSNCMKQQASQRLDVSQDKLESCANHIQDKVSREEDERLAKMSESELKAHIAKQQKKAAAQIESMVKISKTASKGTEHLITLPRYPKAEIVAHYPEGFSLAPGKTGLPVATFTSADDLKTIVAFYKKKLPHFESKMFSNNMYVFMEKIPKGFDPLKDLTAFQNTPHISIYTLPAHRGNKAKNSIEVAYKRR